MNDFGYFEYDDFPENATATVTQDFQKQTESEDIQVFGTFEARRYYYDYASFEGEGYDFEKPLFVYEPMTKIAFTTTELSDENGRFPLTDPEDEYSYFRDVTITPDRAYSGSGITLKTFNKDYSVYILVTDLDGTKGKFFNKTEDEYYPMQFNGLQSIVLSFRKIEPYSFLKIVGYRLGSVRTLDESIWAENPTLSNYYSLDNESLEYDTLDLVIRGGKEDFNIIEGQKITYSSTLQKFFVNDVTYNENGTISITAYDDISRLEKECRGRMRFGDTIDNILSLAIGGHSDITAYIESTIIPNQTYSGTLAGDLTYREALRMMLQGNALTLKKIDGAFELFCPSVYTSDFNVFGITDIIGEPEVEELEKYATVHFSKHRYKLNKKDGKQEVFDGVLLSAVGFDVRFDEPVDTTSTEYYFVIGQNQDGEDILAPVVSSKFILTKQGVYYRTGVTTYTQRIIMLGYMYNTSYSAIDAKIPVAINFKNNQLNISDCTVSMDYTVSTDDDIDYLSNYLAYIYKFRTKIRLQSLNDYNVGERAQAVWNNNSFRGWITAKKSNLNGIYEYEITAEKGVWHNGLG